MNKKILILGGSGLLGKALSNFLENQQSKFAILSRNSEDKTFGEKYNHHSIDILNYKELKNIIKNYDIIINCTGQITTPINHCIKLNSTGMHNIVKAIKKYNKKLIHISTVSIYGRADYVNEKSEINPETPYAVNKFFAEFLIQQKLKNYTILRVSNLFGKSQKKGIINYLTKSYLSNNKNLIFNNNGNLKRYYLHTNDFSSIIKEIIDNNIIGTYNIIGNNLYSIKELILLFEKELNYKFNVEYTNVNPIENINFIDDSKIKNLISYKNKITIINYLKELKNEEF